MWRIKVSFFVVYVILPYSPGFGCGIYHCKLARPILKLRGQKAAILDIFDKEIIYAMISNSAKTRQLGKPTRYVPQRTVNIQPAVS
jgi:hypothetical protein